MSDELTQHPEVWNWRTYILKHGPETANYRLVLLTLSCYMDSAGKSCFPSYDTLEEATCLARATLAKYLKKAVEDGWLEKDLHGYGGQQWARNEYRARIPDEVLKAVQPLNHLSEGSSTEGERQFNRDGKAVQPLNSTSPYTSPSNSSNSSSTRAHEPSVQENSVDAITTAALGERVTNGMKKEAIARACNEYGQDGWDALRAVCRVVDKKGWNATAPLLYKKLQTQLELIDEADEPDDDFDAKAKRIFDAAGRGAGLNE